MALSRKRSPASVRLRLRVVRLNSLAPSRSSSEDIARVTAGGEILSRAPALREAPGIRDRHEHLHLVQAIHRDFPRRNGLFRPPRILSTARGRHSPAVGARSPGKRTRRCEMSKTSLTNPASRRTRGSSVRHPARRCSRERGVLPVAAAHADARREGRSYRTVAVDGCRRVLPRGRPARRPARGAAARVPDLVAHVPQPDPGAGRPLSTSSPRTTRASAIRRCRLATAFAYTFENYARSSAS